jgi:hypothetical protein
MTAGKAIGQRPSGYRRAGARLPGTLQGLKECRSSKPMPELPEVETVRRGLEPVLVGRTITAVRLARQDLRFALPKDFAARLEGRRSSALSAAPNT